MDWFQWTDFFMIRTSVVKELNILFWEACKTGSFEIYPMLNQLKYAEFLETCKRSVPHPDVFWAYHFLWIVYWYPTQKWARIQKYMLFNTLGEGCLSLEQIFVFKYSWTIFNLVFAWNTCVTRTFLGPLFGCPYRSNGTKIHLDAVLTFKDLHFEFRFRFQIGRCFIFLEW